MAATTTYAIPKPTVAGDSGVWGGFLNTGMDTIDNEIARSRIPFVSPTYNVGGTTTLDLNQTTGGRVFKFTVSGASTLAFSNVPSSSFDARITLWITNGSAFVLSFPASVSWTAGIAPTLKASGVDLVDLETNDGGTTWQATLRNLKPGTLFHDFSKTTTSGSEVSLTSYSLPANALAVNGQRVRITVMVQAPAGGAAFKIKFGATNTDSIALTASQTVYIQALVTRTGAATQLSDSIEIYSGAGTLQASPQGAAPAETLSGAVTIDFRGNATVGGQTLTLRTAQIEYLAAA